MNRILSFVSMLGLAVASQTQAAERPNILVVLVDDLGYSDLSCMGGEIPTLSIDLLAANGLRFTACTNSARCCPSRASLLTGLYPHQAGIGSFTTKNIQKDRGPAYYGRLNNSCVTLAEVLGGAGYRTYMVGKWHVGDPGPIARGFNEFYGFVHGYEQNQWKPERYQRLPRALPSDPTYKQGEFYATDAFTDYSLAFLKDARAKNADEKKPWFLYLAHSAPHFPVQAPKESIDRFMPTYRQGWDKLRQARFERMRLLGLATESWKFTERSVVPVDDDKIANGYSGEQNPAWDSLPADRREDLARRMATYAAMVSHINEGMGKIVADLSANGELNNTLILLMSDNGACYEWGPFGFDGPSRKGITKLHTVDELAKMGGPDSYHSAGSGWANMCNTPLRMYKHFTYEGGNCTPMIAHWPAGIKNPNRWVNDPIHLMDVMPTLCDIGNATYPKKYHGNPIQPTEGVSLRGLFEGKSANERAIASEHNGSRSLRRGDWKVVWPVRMPWESSWELYNLAGDRCETNDLAKTNPAKAKQLADEWMAWAKRVGVHFPNKNGKRNPQ